MSVLNKQPVKQIFKSVLIHGTDKTKSKFMYDGRYKMTFRKLYKYHMSMQSSHYSTCPKPGTSKTGFGQMKIMKEFV